MLYRLLKQFVRFCLYFYHKEIKVYGLENIPKNKPVLFLPNHQNALIDVLLIAVDCNRSPYFLARSDIFGKPFLNLFFKYIKMIPIYRIRDGRETLIKNDAIFNSCAQLLDRGEAIVLFPEGNHGLQRRVRPLSKGFTRVVFRALEQSPDLDIHIVPVGLNYIHAEGFPDSVAVYYGEPIAVQSLIDKHDLVKSTANIKEVVAASLKTLTTHISPAVHYDEINNYLKAKGVDFLEPKKCNRLIASWPATGARKGALKNQKVKSSAVFRYILLFLNLPVILSWRWFVYPKVPEAEFIGTFRFAASICFFLLYYSLLFLLFFAVVNFWWALGIVALLLWINWGCVKMYPR